MEKFTQCTSEVGIQGVNKEKVLTQICQGHSFRIRVLGQRSRLQKD